MKTNATQTSIECFHTRVQGEKGDQYSQILSRMKPGKDYSMQELCVLTGLQTSTLSGRLFELRGTGQVEKGPKRRCSISNVTIEPHRLPE